MGFLQSSPHERLFDIVQFDGCFLQPQVVRARVIDDLLDGRPAERLPIDPVEEVFEACEPALQLSDLRREAPRAAAQLGVVLSVDTERIGVVAVHFQDAVHVNLLRR